MPELIAYFSRAGENYVSGNIVDLAVGNTEAVAKMLQESTGADIYRIDPILEYSKGYSECLNETMADQRRDASLPARSSGLFVPMRAAGWDTVWRTSKGCARMRK